MLLSPNHTNHEKKKKKKKKKNQPTNNDSKPNQKQAIKQANAKQAGVRWPMRRSCSVIKSLPPARVRNESRTWSGESVSFVCSTMYCTNCCSVMPPVPSET